jgi:hypothetical protein
MLSAGMFETISILQHIFPKAGVMLNGSVIWAFATMAAVETSADIPTME